MGAKDGVLQWWIANGDTISRQRKVQSQPMQASNWTIANKHFDMFIAPGWMGNTTVYGAQDIRMSCLSMPISTWPSGRTALR